MITRGTYAPLPPHRLGHYHASMSIIKRKPVIGWALYDWANSTYSTTVVAGFFPVFFKEYWAAGSAATESSFYLGVAHTVSALVLALIAPLLGAIADYARLKLPLLLVFTALSIAATAALFFVPAGAWQAALWIFALSNFGFAAVYIFYDALLLNVCAREEDHFVSSLGYALGYLGGGILFAVNIAMVLSPATFGLAGKADAVRWSFITVALWWALFSVPTLLWVREPKKARVALGAAVIAGMGELSRTFHAIRRLRTVWMFLLAYWFYIDAVGTVYRMAVDFGVALGFDSGQLLLALLLAQFVGFPGALAFAPIANRYGAKLAIYIAIGGYLIASFWILRVNHVAEFYGIAAIIGLVQGGLQALSRSFFAHIIPKDKAGEFFGFYNMLGKFAAILGPVLMGAIALSTGSTRLSILAVVALFVIGAAFLSFVTEPKRST